jgi:DNA-directed RNA polymerase
MADGAQNVPDEPWQFIAACEEFYALYLAPIAERRNATNLPVAVDASCSGIQILSGLIKDATAAKLVNVLPSEQKQDAYQAVADIVVAKMQKPVTLERLSETEFTKGGKPKTEKYEVDLSAYAHLVNRSVVKKLVMTFAYNASPMSQAIYLRDALKPVRKQIANEQYGEFVSAVGILGRAAMKKLMPQVFVLKEWLAKAAAQEAKAAKDGVLRFTTLSGVTLGQRKNKIRTVTIKTAFGGVSRKVELAVKEDPEVSVQDHKTCTMPNVVHALDASLLHVAFAEFDKPFALIHDSVLATASDMDAAIKNYKDAFIAHFGDGEAYDALAGMIGNEEMPKQGTLKVEEVLDSQFFLA